MCVLCVSVCECSHVCVLCLCVNAAMCVLCLCVNAAMCVLCVSVCECSTLVKLHKKQKVFLLIFIVTDHIKGTLSTTHPNIKHLGFINRHMSVHSNESHPGMGTVQWKNF